MSLARHTSHRGAASIRAKPREIGQRHLGVDAVDRSTQSQLLPAPGRGANRKHAAARIFRKG
jgi:hypothetical protein